MQTLPADLVPKTCLVYLDDVIIHGKNLEEHIENLRKVLRKLRDVGLRLSPGKCHLLRSSVKYLGHIVSTTGVECDPEKTKAVEEWPRPKSAEEVRSFLGLAAYYRRFVNGFASIASPMYKLLEKETNFSWTEEIEQAFKTLKEALSSPPVLGFPDFSAEAGMFILDTDACDVGIGAVLSQKDASGRERVISYASRSLTKPERNYCTTRKEMLSLVAYVKYFRHYLLGRKFLVRTDHKSLNWLRNFRDPEGQIARWQEYLQEFDFDCQHRPGKKHQNADALSRRPIRSHGDCPSCSEGQVMVVNLALQVTNNWAEWQANDLEIKLIYERLTQGGERPSTQEMEGRSYEAKCLWALWDQLIIMEGVLCYQIGPTYTRRVVVPQSALDVVLTKLHEELGHAGINKMVDAARRRYWWPHQHRDIKNFCNACDLCQRVKPSVYLHAPLKPVLAGYPNEIVEVDLMGPLFETARNNRYILVMVDHFTKWCEAVAISNAEATTVAQAIFDHWVARWGAPLQLHSDRGTNFESLVVSELCTILGVRKTRTTAYHPQGNGLVERTNRTLKTLLKTCVDRENAREWDVAIPKCLMAYRASVHSSTQQTPACMMTGRELRLPSDLTLSPLREDRLLSTEFVVKMRQNLNYYHQMARKMLTTSQQHQKEFYDKKVHGAPLNPGDKVLLFRENPPPGAAAKFHRQWVGPFVVCEILSDCTCRIKDETRVAESLVVHFNRLKPYRERNLQREQQVGITQQSSRQQGVG